MTKSCNQISVFESITALVTLKTLETSVTASPLLLLQVRGEGGDPLGLHHRSGSLGCGLDGLRPETPSQSRVDAGGWSSGAG